MVNDPVRVLVDHFGWQCRRWQQVKQCEFQFFFMLFGACAMLMAGLAVPSNSPAYMIFWAMLFLMASGIQLVLAGERLRLRVEGHCG
jgi:hypothetical protein